MSRELPDEKSPLLAGAVGGREAWLQMTVVHTHKSKNTYNTEKTRMLINAELWVLPI